MAAYTLNSWQRMGMHSDLHSDVRYQFRCLDRNRESVVPNPRAWRIPPSPCPFRIFHNPDLRSRACRSWSHASCSCPSLAAWNAKGHTGSLPVLPRRNLRSAHFSNTDRGEDQTRRLGVLLLITWRGRGCYWRRDVVVMARSHSLRRGVSGSVASPMDAPSLLGTWKYLPAKAPGP